MDRTGRKHIMVWEPLAFDEPARCRYITSCEQHECDATAHYNNNIEKKIWDVCAANGKPASFIRHRIWMRQNYFSVQCNRKSFSIFFSFWSRNAERKKDWWKMWKSLRCGYMCVAMWSSEVNVRNGLKKTKRRPKNLYNN